MIRPASARAKAVLVLGTAAVLGALVVPMASGAATAGKAKPASAPVIEEDFHITAPPVLRAGRVKLVVTNAGPDDHELVVVRRSGDELPLRADGLTVDEHAIRSRVAGSVEAGKPGTRTLRVKLRPGRYELFCNMSGHYLGGMEANIEVSR